MDEIRFEFDCDTSAMHFHDEMEIMYVLSGRIGIMLQESNYALGTEDFIVFNLFEHHEMYREAGCHTLSLYLPFSFLQQCELEEIFCCSAVQQEKQEYLFLLRKKLAVIYKDYSEHYPDRRLYILSEVYELLALLKQHFSVKISRDSEEGQKLLQSNKMRQILLYLNEHFTENISLQEVAVQNYMSPGHLSRLFDKVMNRHFSDYLRMLRLNRAAYLLRSTNSSIIEIAEISGFHNVNTLTVNFKNEYGETPSSYRKHRKSVPDEQRKNDIDKAYLVHLLNYALEENISPLNRQYMETDNLKINVKEKQGRLEPKYNLSVGLGRAANFFIEGCKEALKKCVQEIGFQYVCVNGIFDESTNVYHENLDGTPWFNYTYMDMILDFICSIGAKPWLVLSHTPEKLLNDKKMMYDDAYVQLPGDMEKWAMFLGDVMGHLIRRYGFEQVCGWRLGIFPPLYISYDLFTLEDYLEYYYCTWNKIREYFPDIIITGGTFDIGYLRLDGPELMIRFLDYCQKFQCMPDELSLQSFAIDYSAVPRKEIEARILVKVTKHDAEPAPPHQDRDLLCHELEFIRDILDQEGLAGLPVSIMQWGSTIWSYDLGNDTCYKAAYVVKNILENIGNYAALNYNIFYDTAFDRYNLPPVFYGDGGMVSYTGVPKAVFHAYSLLSRLGGTILSQGDGYMAVCSEDRERIQIILYHYCHYNFDVHLDQVLPREEQLTIDRYYAFEDSGIRSFQIDLIGLGEGVYHKETYIINRENGSSYDIWSRMGAPVVLSGKQKEYLESMSEPRYQYERVRITGGGEMLLSAALEPHEVRLICLSIKNDKE